MVLPGSGAAVEAVAGALGKGVQTLATQPLDRTQQRLGDIAGQLAAAGVDVSDDDLQLGAKRIQEQERRRVLAERRSAGVVYSTGNVLDALSFAFSVYR
jgi:hypothetical protein